MEVAAPAIPPKPKIAATIAIMKKTTAQESIVYLPCFAAVEPAAGFLFRGVSAQSVDYPHS